MELQFQRVLRHLYINPLEKCNLRCAICYTKKTSPVLSQEQILSFIDTYQSSQELDTITFCGGEVFTLPYFPHLVNTLTDKKMFIQIITNGTIDRLSEFANPNSVNLIVSLDGLPKYHDQNRGAGNFAKSMAFLQLAHTSGFHTEIFSIVTQENYPYMEEFETVLQKNIRPDISVTYHPRKPPAYLSHHPVSNIYGTVKGFSFLSAQQMITLLETKKTFPPKNLGCFQIALVSNGLVYGCCEGPTPIGTMNDDVPVLIESLRKKVREWDDSKFHDSCLGCSYPGFLCGMHQYFQLIKTP